MPTLPLTSNNSVSGTWSPSAIDNQASGNYIFTPTAGQCTDNFTLNVTITNPITPTFAIANTFCKNAIVPTLPTTSNNGISGNWSPSVIDNQASGSYVFTPTSGQCADNFTLNVTITNPTIPTFTIGNTFCKNAVVPVLPATSNNGFSGTWSPNIIDSQASNNYIFTPNAGQCADNFTLNVTVTNPLTPTFTIANTFCKNAIVPTLPTTSNNGISGNWSPSVIDNQASGSYVFTPTSGQCADNFTLNVTITNPTIPTFTIGNTFCKNAVVPVLPATSNNGISGTWSPNVIDNQASDTYVFTPTSGQCADNFTLNVTITNPLTPTFTITNNFCKNAVVPVLPSTSNNSVSGTWSPNVIDNQASSNYIFTPTAGQCATTFTLNVTITNPTTPTFTIANSFCKNAIVPTLTLTSNNIISGSWSPNVIDNQISGSYVFTPTAGQCASTFTLNVIIANPTTPTFAIANNFCKNAVVPTLPATSNNIISGSWSPNVIDNQISSNYIFTPTAGQCADNFTLNVSIVVPSISYAYVSICINDLGVGTTTILNTNLSTSNFIINWTKDNAIVATNQSNILVSDKSIYQATATNIITGCVSIFNYNVIEINPLTYEIVVGEDFSQNQNISVITSGGSGQYEYSFDNQPFQSESTFYAQDGGDILVKIRDLNKCYEVSKLATIWQYPRFFTPNNDGFNDFWKIKSNKTIIIDIFDRYGKLIKQLKTNDSWDGTFNNAALPATDYWFVVYYNENKTFKSHFALKR